MYGTAMICGLTAQVLTTREVAQQCPADTIGVLSAFQAYQSMGQSFLVGPFALCHLHWASLKGVRHSMWTMGGVSFAVGVLGLGVLLPLSVMKIMHQYPDTFLIALVIFVNLSGQLLIGLKSNQAEVEGNLLQTLTLVACPRVIALIGTSLTVRSKTWSSSPEILLLCYGVGSLLVYLVAATFWKVNLPKPVSSVELQSSSSDGTFVGFVLARYPRIMVGYATQWLLTTSDRLVISATLQPEQMAKYSVNYGYISQSYNMALGPIEFAFRQKAYQLRTSTVGSWRTVRARLILSACIAVLIAVIWTVLYGNVLAFLARDTLYVSREVQWCLHAAHGTLLVGSSFVAYLQARDRLLAISLVTTAAGICGLTINIILIPKIGLLGAAISTLSGYLVWAILLWALTRTAMSEKPGNIPEGVG